MWRESVASNKSPHTQTTLQYHAQSQGSNTNDVHILVVERHLKHMRKRPEIIYPVGDVTSHAWKDSSSTIINACVTLKYYVIATNVKKV